MTKVVFYASAKPREQLLASYLKEGVEAAGSSFELRKTSDYGEDEFENDRKYPGPTDDTDIAVFFGVKGISRKIIDDHLAMGRHTLFLDKGYTRQKGDGGHTFYSRISIDAGSPVDYMMDNTWPGDRLESLKIKTRPYRPVPGGHILYASSSQKYNDFFSLGDSGQCAYKTLQRLGKLSPRLLVYRPKPSDRRARPIAGIALSTKAQSMQQALVGCHVLVTYGSTASMDAIIQGVPSIVLGDAIAAPVAQREATASEHVDKPFFPNDIERDAWLRAVAYQQYTNRELRSGMVWSYVQDQIKAIAKIKARRKAEAAAAAARDAEIAADAAAIESAKCKG